MRVALLQLEIAWEDVTANHARASRLLRDASERGARLAILPEMFATGFSMDSSRIAQEAGGKTEQWLCAMARALGLFVLAGVAETVSARGASSTLPFNNALLVSPDGEVGRFSKLHPFTFAGEDRSFSAGDGVVTWYVEGVRVTPLICYDLRFPEPFRVAAGDTDLFVVIANWPHLRRSHWQTLLRARAVENLAFVAGVNRVGDGGGLHYVGDSALVSPWGETLVSAAEQENVLISEVDPAVVLDARAKFPALSDRRPEAYTRRA